MDQVLGLIKKNNLRMDSNGNSRTVLFYFKIKTSGQTSCKTWSCSCLKRKGERESRAILAATEVRHVTDKQPKPLRKACLA